ncbi:hypothetical protein EGI15_05715 [Chryseobacterium cucumeris]|uniref:Polysaccharide pyruvyl transferase domain-containing protein n=1 Tax=Chryseobacterium cucumeris TaxID=1813611 RepID=A0ABX9XEX9_9FLAO|nr:MULTISPECIES: polysaccharide pyruvyl transferase family protein [Chryseobacterium]RKE77099.1 pyruvyl transferase EpsI [Chryseobacterium sp. AG363]ROH95352.1 hypothetical protein EGI15_05715 [Chryseobacterium cucumeris]
MDLFNKIKNKANSIINNIQNNARVDKIADEITNCRSKRLFLFQTPTHTNIGDHAIAEGQLKFFQENLPGHHIFEINQSQMKYFIEKYRNNIKPDDLIFVHGGGNFGNEYMREENLRRMVIQNFPENKIILFPQTIYYSNDQIGESELKRTQDIFGKHKNLILTAREEKSFELMQKYFPKNKIILTPDIVLYTEYSFENEREYALEVIRNDQESILTADDKDKITQILKGRFDKIINSDMHCDKITDLDIKSVRKKILTNKLLQFSKAKIVVTDRLHGMVLCIITGTPCVVFSNYNQKVIGTYNWIKYLKYIKFVKNVEEANTAIDELLNNDSYEKYNPQEIRKFYLPLIENVNE